MEHLTSEDMKQLREQLMSERRRLVEDLQAAAGVHDNLHPDPAGDQQDLALAEATNRAGAAIGRREEQRLHDIDAALTRMELGTYGICEVTGEPIPRARLMAEPTTRYTVEALEQLEEERARERTQFQDPTTDLY